MSGLDFLVKPFAELAMSLVNLLLNRPARDDDHPELRFPPVQMERKLCLMEERFR